MEEARRDDGIERQPAPPGGLSRWRRGSAIGAVVTATAAGVRHEPEAGDDRDAVVEEHAAEEADDQAVVLYLVPGVPEASLALVRPWLLPSARARRST